jgi:hypothetical protein
MSSAAATKRRITISPLVNPLPSPRATFRCLTNRRPRLQHPQPVLLFLETIGTQESAQCLILLHILRLRPTNVPKATLAKPHVPQISGRGLSSAKCHAAIARAAQQEIPVRFGDSRKDACNLQR